MKDIEIQRSTRACDVRAKAKQTLQGIALLDGQGEAVLAAVQAHPPADDCAAICAEYFGLLKALGQGLPAARPAPEIPPAERKRLEALGYAGEAP